MVLLMLQLWRQSHLVLAILLLLLFTCRSSSAKRLLLSSKNSELIFTFATVVCDVDACLDGGSSSSSSSRNMAALPGATMLLECNHGAFSIALESSHEGHLQAAAGLPLSETDDCSVTMLFPAPVHSTCSIASSSQRVFPGLVGKPQELVYRPVECQNRRILASSKKGAGASTNSLSLGPPDPPRP